MKKIVAECLGTFILVFFGTATAVLGEGIKGIGVIGIASGFGLAVTAAIYSVGMISGAHLNPAVSLSMLLSKRMSLSTCIKYMFAQFLGAIVASFTLLCLLNVSHKASNNLGQNSFGQLSMYGALAVEIILTFIFVLVILIVTSKKKQKDNNAGLIIGITLAMVHMVGIPLTGTSVNPARSLAPALLLGGQALSQVWVFIVAPMIGGVLASIIGKWLLAKEK
ncbi:MIP/aquaporin family protein [Enterococcus termitis]|uniref:Aquaporin n=1 Tax=Enterococcus termitis TaxID=332950 RepID=A0A1E5GB96_9ENTE|nr:MIP family channel protein [Enterococcus termitis]OEG09982.1 aquaporin [Enterococcus termitis]